MWSEKITDESDQDKENVIFDHTTYFRIEKIYFFLLSLYCACSINIQYVKIYNYSDFWFLSFIESKFVYGTKYGFVGCVNMLDLQNWISHYPITIENLISKYFLDFLCCYCAIHSVHDNFSLFSVYADIKEVYHFHYFYDCDFAKIKIDYYRQHDFNQGRLSLPLIVNRQSNVW